MITYPRTDSRALPEDYLPVVKEALGNLAAPLDQFARRVLEQNWVRPNKRIFNNAQVERPLRHHPDRVGEQEPR